MLAEAVGDGAAAPRLDDPQLEAGLRGLRVTRARQANRQVYKWNAALAGLAEQIAGAAGQPAAARQNDVEDSCERVTPALQPLNDANASTWACSAVPPAAP